jgi:hypothetical protein
MPSTGKRRAHTTASTPPPAGHSVSGAAESSPRSPSPPSTPRRRFVFVLCLCVCAASFVGGLIAGRAFFSHPKAAMEKDHDTGRVAAVSPADLTAYDYSMWWRRLPRTPFNSPLSSPPIWRRLLS